MTDVLTHRDDGPSDAPRRTRTRRVMRGVGWLLFTAGALVLLYLIYSLFYTDLINGRTQDALLEEWQLEYGPTERPAHPDPLAILEGVDPESLKRGPGHYPGTAAPGQLGNFAVAGHRTTYGAPLYHADQFRPGDRIHVIDRQQRRWLYEVVDTRVVLPSDVWVIGPDPLGTGRPMLSLTTCEPRFSATKRLMVFAELRTDVEA